MTILALETATRAGSVALAANGTVEAARGDATRTHGERLPRELLDFLHERGHTLDDVDRLAVIVGPGSFTGLRVGIAAIQGLALPAGRLVVPIPTLPAVFDGWRAEARIDRPTCAIAWMDGQRGDLFFAAWTMDPPEFAPVQTAPPRVGRPDDVIALLRSHSDGRDLVLASPDDVPARDVVRAAQPAATFARVATPLAAIAARLAAAHPDQAVTPHALRPIYLRRPDAELARERAAEAARRSAEAATGSGAPPTSVAILRAGPNDDISEVDVLQRRSFTNPWGADSIRWELTNTDVARLYLARDRGGPLVGYCACWLVFDELHINSLAVEPDWRRRGVARTLIAAVLDDARAAGARSATLEVRRSNTAALALYEGLGFTVEAVRRDYYQSPREDALILWNRRVGAGA